MNLADYFAMGGFAIFIWPGYVLALLLLLGLFLVTARRLKEIERSEIDADRLDDGKP